MYPAVKINKIVLSLYILFLCFKLGDLEIEEKTKRNNSVNIVLVSIWIWSIFKKQHVKCFIILKPEKKTKTKTKKLWS